MAETAREREMSDGGVHRADGGLLLPVWRRSTSGRPWCSVGGGRPAPSRAPRAERASWMQTIGTGWNRAAKDWADIADGR